MAEQDVYRDDKIAALRNTDHGDSSDEQRGPGLEKSHSDDDLALTEDAATGGLTGVEKIRATTQAWTKPWLIVAFILLVPDCNPPRHTKSRLKLTTLPVTMAGC